MKSELPQAASEGRKLSPEERLAALRPRPVDSVARKLEELRAGASGSDGDVEARLRAAVGQVMSQRPSVQDQLAQIEAGLAGGTAKTKTLAEEKPAAPFAFEDPDLAALDAKDSGAAERRKERIIARVQERHARHEAFQNGGGRLLNLHLVVESQDIQDARNAGMSEREMKEVILEAYRQKIEETRKGELKQESQEIILADLDRLRQLSGSEEYAKVREAARRLDNAKVSLAQGVRYFLSQDKEREHALTAYGLRGDVAEAYVDHLLEISSLSLPSGERFQGWQSAERGVARALPESLSRVLEAAGRMEEQKGGVSRINLPNPERYLQAFGLITRFLEGIAAHIMSIGPGGNLPLGDQLKALNLPGREDMAQLPPDGIFINTATKRRLEHRRRPGAPLAEIDLRSLEIDLQADVRSAGQRAQQRQKEIVLAVDAEWASEELALFEEENPEARNLEHREQQLGKKRDLATEFKRAELFLGVHDQEAFEAVSIAVSRRGDQYWLDTNESGLEGNLRRLNDAVARELRPAAAEAEAKLAAEMKREVGLLQRRSSKQKTIEKLREAVTAAQQRLREAQAQADEEQNKINVLGRLASFLPLAEAVIPDQSRERTPMNVGSLLEAIRQGAATARNQELLADERSLLQRKRALQDNVHRTAETQRRGQ